MAMTLISPRQRSHAASATSAVYVPPGWPEQVRPPGAPDWESTAVAFLLDCCPADYRGYPLLQRHPVVLAGFAADVVEAQLRATRHSLGELRSRLHGHVEPEVVQSATEVCLEQEAALVRTRRAVALVEESLRGKVFLRRL